MAIPDYQTFMVPLLEYASDGITHKFVDACDALAKQFSISDAELKELLPSGRYPVFRSRVSWAKTYLTKACLLEIPKRGHFQITDRGKTAFGNDRDSINSAYLMRYPEFRSFQKGGGDSSDNSIVAKNGKLQSSPLVNEKTPDEQLSTAVYQLQKSLIEDLAATVRLVSPQFFEYLVVQLLVAMGYGGSFKDAAQVVGKSGDNGIDGIIKEDRLGLDNIYIQAKRWDDKKPISNSEIHKFVGALTGFGATKGVFITTGRFTEMARKYAKSLSAFRVVLIDGEELCRYMIDFNIGVSIKESYVVKKIDTDFFDEEQM